MRWISRSRRGKEQCKNGHSIWATPSVQSEVLGNKYQSKTEESIQKVLIQQKAITKKSQHFGLLQGCGDIETSVACLYRSGDGAFMHGFLMMS